MLSVDHRIWATGTRTMFKATLLIIAALLLNSAQSHAQLAEPTKQGDCPIWHAKIAVAVGGVIKDDGSIGSLPFDARDFKMQFMCSGTPRAYVIVAWESSKTVPAEFWRMVGIAGAVRTGDNASTVLSAAKKCRDKIKGSSGDDDASDGNTFVECTYSKSFEILSFAIFSKAALQRK